MANGSPDRLDTETRVLEEAVKLTVLVDNNTLIDRYFIGEPGVSYLLEADGQKILFDVGYSDAFIANARRLGIDLLDVDGVVLSHGHLDHTWGIVPLIRLFTEGAIERKTAKRPWLVAHPGILARKTHGTCADIGVLVGEDVLSSHFDLRLSRTPVRLTEGLTFLGEIDRVFEFEGNEPIGSIIENGQQMEDRLLDDSAVVYRSHRGLVIITGCSHSGICNIVERARRLTGDTRVADIIGGFHLLKPAESRLTATLEYLKAVDPESVHACHCTDFASRVRLAGSLRLAEVGAGLRLEY